MAFVNFSDIRQINAFDYLTRFEDFSVSPKSNKSWVNSNKPTGFAVIEHLNTGDKFLVSKDNNNSLEFRISTTDGSTIPTGRSASRKVDLLSFVAWLHNEDFKKAASRIADNIPHLNSIVNQPNFTYKTPAVSLSQSELSNKVFSNTRPTNDYSYLTKRGLNNSIIAEPLFNGRISAYVNHQHNNLCFNCYDASDRFVTTCQRYFLNDKAVKQFPYFKDPSGTNQSPSTTGTIWRSNLPKEPTYILLSESPEDAISYYQLHHSSLKDKTLLVSSLGNFRVDQARVISSICAQHPFSKIILANDNDAAGIRFDLMALCAIKPANSGHCPILNASASLITNEQHIHLNKLHFSFSFDNKDFQYANELYDLIDHHLIKNNTRLADSEGLYKSDDNKWHFDLYCKNDVLHVEDIFHFVKLADHQHYFTDHFLIDKPNDVLKVGQQEKSVVKDWNEFLSYQQPNQLKLEHKIHFFESVKVENTTEKKNFKLNKLTQ